MAQPPDPGSYPYVYLDGICLKRSWGGEVKNVSVLVAIAVNDSGYREVLGVAEGKEDKEGWSGFLRHLKNRDLKEVQLIISDKCLMLAGARLRHVAGTKWGTRRYINMDHFKEIAEDSAA